MNDPGDPSNPLQGLLGDLLKVMGSAGGPGRAGVGAPWWESARALAYGVATDGEPEANTDPLVRITLEELARVAELHVADVTGLPVCPSSPGEKGATSGGAPLSFVAVSRGTLALKVLEAWRPLLDEIVSAQASAPRPAIGGLGGLGDLSDLGDLGDLGDLSGLGDLSELGRLGSGLSQPGGEQEAGGIADLLGQFAATMGPVLVGLQFGSAVGHLAQRALGQYALPLPWPPSNELLVVPQNISVFANEWSLPVEETQLWVCIRELTTHTVLSRPHVAERIRSLLHASIKDAVDAQQGLAERFGGQGSDPGELENLLSDPESLLADLLTPGQQRTSAELVALTTTLGGYVDHVTARIAENLTGSAPALTEAWYRYRVREAKGEQAAGALFGLDLARREVDRGAAFVRGVVERKGEDALARLWASDTNLPTPAEVDAPGLWLERIDLPAEELSGGETPGDETSGDETPGEET